MKKIILNIVMWYMVGVAFLFLMSYSVNRFTGIEYNLDLTTHVYQDVCVGDQKQLVSSARTVVPAQGFPATIKGELFRLEDGQFIETTIRRISEFTYQPNGGETFQFEVAWVDHAYNPPKPYTFPDEGVYAAGEFVTITPIPSVTKSEYYPPSEQVFSVVDCNYD